MPLPPADPEVVRRNGELMRRLATIGVSFAFPTQTLFVRAAEGFGGHDAAEPAEADAARG